MTLAMGARGMHSGLAELCVESKCELLFQLRTLQATNAGQGLGKRIGYKHAGPSRLAMLEQLHVILHSEHS